MTETYLSNFIKINTDFDKENNNNNNYYKTRQNSSTLIIHLYEDFYTISDNNKVIYLKETRKFKELEKSLNSNHRKNNKKRSNLNHSKFNVINNLSNVYYSLEVIMINEKTYFNNNLKTTFKRIFSKNTKISKLDISASLDSKTNIYILIFLSLLIKNNSSIEEIKLSVPGISNYIKDVEDKSSNLYKVYKLAYSLFENTIASRLVYLSLNKTTLSDISNFITSSKLTKVKLQFLGDYNVNHLDLIISLITKNTSSCFERFQLLIYDVDSLLESTDFKQIMINCNKHIRRLEFSDLKENDFIPIISEGIRNKIRLSYIKVSRVHLNSSSSNLELYKKILNIELITNNNNSSSCNSDDYCLINIRKLLNIPTIVFDKIYNVDYEKTINKNNISVVSTMLKPMYVIYLMLYHKFLF